MATTKSVLFVKYATPNEILAAATVLPVVSITIVLIRYYIRISRKHKIGLDDHFLIPALLAIIGWGATFIVGVHDKIMGYPTPGQTTEQGFLYSAAATEVIFLKLEFVIFICLILAFGTIKLSILFFYRRLFVVSNKHWFSYVTWAAIAVIAGWTVTFLILTTGGCRDHITDFWGSREAEITNCIDTYDSEEALHVSEFLSNVLVAFLPIPLIWQLHLPTYRKLQVIGIMLLGFLAIAISIVRLIILLDITTKAENYIIDHDQTVTTLFYWGLIEANLALIASCLPTIHVLPIRQSVVGIIRSGRSLISLRTGGSSRDGHAELKDSTNFGRQNKESLSLENFESTSTKVEATASQKGSLKDDRAQKNGEKNMVGFQELVSPGQVRVQREVLLTEDMV